MGNETATAGFLLVVAIGLIVGLALIAYGVLP